MTDAQKTLRDLRDRQSRERGKMAELSRVEALSDEQRSEFDRIETGTPDLERQIRAAGQAIEQEETEQRTAQTAGDDPEMRERIELRGRASLTGYLLAAARGRLVSGAEAELQAAAGVEGIPLELWDIPEQRAVADVPGTVGVNLDTLRPAVFANSIAPLLGIEMPRVMSGTYASATISTSQSAAALAKSAAAAGVAGAFTVTTATPKRVSARLELTLEDIAAVGQENYESILRENISLVLSDALDTQVINGNGTAPNLKGLFRRCCCRTPRPRLPALLPSTISWRPLPGASMDSGRTPSRRWPSSPGSTRTSCQPRRFATESSTPAIEAASAWATSHSPITPCRNTPAGGRTSACPRKSRTSSKPSFTGRAAA